MSDRKFTPGPWRVAGDTNHDTRRIYGPDGYMVADAGRIPKRREQEMDANARLIAAAPELFKVAEMLVNLEAHEWAQIPAPIMRAAIEAMGKVEGEAS